MVTRLDKEFLYGGEHRGLDAREPELRRPVSNHWSQEWQVLAIAGKCSGSLMCPAAIQPGREHLQLVHACAKNRASLGAGLALRSGAAGQALLTLKTFFEVLLHALRVL